MSRHTATRTSILIARTLWAVIFAGTAIVTVLGVVPAMHADLCIYAGIIIGVCQVR